MVLFHSISREEQHLEDDVIRYAQLFFWLDSSVALEEDSSLVGRARLPPHRSFLLSSSVSWTACAPS